MAVCVWGSWGERVEGCKVKRGGFVGGMVGMEFVCGCGARRIGGEMVLPQKTKSTETRPSDQKNAWPDCHQRSSIRAQKRPNNVQDAQERQRAPKRVEELSRIIDKS